MDSRGEIRIGQDLDYKKEEGGVENGIYALVSFMNLKNDEIVGCWFEGDGDDDGLSESEVEKLIDESCKMSKLIRANLNSYLLKSFS